MDLLILYVACKCITLYGIYVVIILYVVCKFIVLYVVHGFINYICCMYIYYCICYMLYVQFLIFLCCIWIYNFICCM